MATNLTPEQLAAILARYNAGNTSIGGGGSGYGGEGGGFGYGTTGGWNGGEAGMGEKATLSHIYQDAQPGKHGVGDVVNIYDPSGNFLNAHTLDRTDLYGSAMENYLGPLLLAATGVGMAGGFGALGGGAAGGPGSAGWGADLGMEGLAGTGSAPGATGGLFNAAADSQLANVGIDAAGGNALGGYTAAGAGGVTGAPLGAGGLSMNSLLPAGASSLLGPAASVLGAASGAKGQESGSSTTKDIPEWLKPFAMQNLNAASGLLAKQMAPGYMQGYDDMRSVGQGLLNQPIAGNGFAQFQAKPRFGG